MQHSIWLLYQRKFVLQVKRGNRPSVKSDVFSEAGLDTYIIQPVKMSLKVLKADQLLSVCLPNGAHCNCHLTVCCAVIRQNWSNCVLTGGPGRWPHPTGCADTAAASTAAGVGRASPGASASVSNCCWSGWTGLCGAKLKGHLYCIFYSLLLKLQSIIFA